jgi:type II secretory pathway component PulC
MPSAAAKDTLTKAPQPSTASKAAKAPEAATPRQAAADADPFASVDRLEANSPIKLQAISWAQDKDQSITVINNTILHEGDSVEGYTVVKIRPDDVILRRSGRMWRATFSLR